MRWLALAACVLALGLASVRPSNDRDWSPDQRVLARTVFDGSLVHERAFRFADAPAFSRRIRRLD